MAYSKLLWGFIFLFDLRIGGFDVLPDIIGYIFFYQGLSILEDKNEFFSNAKKFALPMIFISIFDIYQVSNPNEFSNNSLGILGIILGLIVVVINLMMVYNICFGIASEARETNNFELESKANSAWKLYLISNILISFSIILLGILQFLFIIVLVVSIIAYIMMLRLMKAASNELV